MLVLAHRGASAYAPENTEPAFRKAIELGADGVELDVHLCKDGHMVVNHNFDVDHNSDGLGLIEDLKGAEAAGLRPLERSRIQRHVYPHFGGSPGDR